MSVTKDRKFITINCNSRSTSEVSVTGQEICVRIMKLIVTDFRVAGLYLSLDN